MSAIPHSNPAPARPPKPDVPVLLHAPKKPSSWRAWVLLALVAGGGWAAYQFLAKIKKDAPEEISWLPANKYSFYLISDENLQLLKTNKDIPAYRGLLNKAYPGKF